MVSGVGGTKPSSLSPFLFHLYTAVGCLDEEEWRFYKAAQVDEAYGFAARMRRERRPNRKNPEWQRQGPLS